MNAKTSEEKFYENIIALGDLMVELITEIYSKGYKVVDPILCKVAVEILKKFPSQQMLENFIYYSYIHWDSIFKKEESYFISHASDIFSDLPSQSVDSFKVLFETTDNSGKKVIPKEDRDAIIDFHWSFVKIAIPYIHKYQNDKTKVYKTGKIKNGKNANGDDLWEDVKAPYSAIPIVAIAQKWNIKL